MGVIKNLRSKLRRQRDEKTPMQTQAQSPDDVFRWTFFNIGFARDKLMVSISCWRRVFPDEPLGSWRSRVWIQMTTYNPGDIVQINPNSSENFGGCCMIVDDAGEDNVYGYVIVPSRDGRQGISMCLPKRDLRKVGRCAWKSDRITLIGAQR